ALRNFTPIVVAHAGLWATDKRCMAEDHPGFFGHARKGSPELGEWAGHILFGIARMVPVDAFACLCSHARLPIRIRETSRQVSNAMSAKRESMGTAGGLWLSGAVAFCACEAICLFSNSRANYCAIESYPAALRFSKKCQGADEPLALV